MGESGLATAKHLSFLSLKITHHQHAAYVNSAAVLATIGSSDGRISE
jgi:hypothetical protein